MSTLSVNRLIVRNALLSACVSLAHEINAEHAQTDISARVEIIDANIISAQERKNLRMIENDFIVRYSNFDSDANVNDAYLMRRVRVCERKHTIVVMNHNRKREKNRYQRRLSYNLTTTRARFVRQTASHIVEFFNLSIYASDHNSRVMNNLIAQAEAQR